MKKRVGKFDVYVNGAGTGSVYASLTYENQTIADIPHTELRDLEFAVQRMISAARLKLPDQRKDEMD